MFNMYDKELICDISHQYFDIDAEVIYYVCKKHIRPLSKTIKKMISNIK